MAQLMYDNPGIRQRYLGAGMTVKVPGTKKDSLGTSDTWEQVWQSKYQVKIPGSRYDRSWNYRIQVRIHHSLERINIWLSGCHSETVKITKWQLWWYSLNDAIIQWRDDYWQWRHNTMTKSRWRSIKMQLKSLLQWTYEQGRSPNMADWPVILYCTVLYCTILYCTVLYCTVLYCTVLYCTVLQSTVLPLYFATE